MAGARAHQPHGRDGQPRHVRAQVPDPARLHGGGRVRGAVGCGHRVGAGALTHTPTTQGEGLRERERERDFMAVLRIAATISNTNIAVRWDMDPRCCSTACIDVHCAGVFRFAEPVSIPVPRRGRGGHDGRVGRHHGVRLGVGLRIHLVARSRRYPTQHAPVRAQLRPLLTACHPGEEGPSCTPPPSPQPACGDERSTTRHQKRPFGLDVSVSTLPLAPSQSFSPTSELPPALSPHQLALAAGKPTHDAAAGAPHGDGGRVGPDCVQRRAVLRVVRWLPLARCHAAPHELSMLPGSPSLHARRLSLGRLSHTGEKWEGGEPYSCQSLGLCACT
jgi:hypothetical protein